MDIWQCSECLELMVANIHPDKNWRFNGDCFQHNCEGIKRIMKECGYPKDYPHASKKLSGNEILSQLSASKATIETLRGENKTLEDFCQIGKEQLDEYADKIDQLQADLAGEGEMILAYKDEILAYRKDCFGNTKIIEKLQAELAMRCNKCNTVETKKAFDRYQEFVHHFLHYLQKTGVVTGTGDTVEDLRDKLQTELDKAKKLSQCPCCHCNRR